MRVLHIVEGFAGGLFEVVRQIAEGGVAAGDQVGIAYGVREQTPADLREQIAEEVELMPVASWRRGVRLRRIAAPPELRRLAREWRPELVHLHSSVAGAGGAVALRRHLTLFSPQAFASSLTGRDPVNRSVYRAVERMIVRRVTVTHAASGAEARYAREVLGAPRVEMIENGIPELDDPPSPPVREQPPVVIASGRITAQRQPLACARILERVKDVAVVRWVGGTATDNRDGDVAALEAAGVEVTGWVSRSESVAQMGRASAYLHWSSADGQALSIMEAMALDVPVVASDIPASRDVLPPEQLCKDEEEAAVLLHRILRDERFAERIRSGQRARRERYSARRMVSETLQLYRRLLDERTAAGGPGAAVTAPPRSRSG